MSGQHVVRILQFRSLLEHCLVDSFSSATLAHFHDFDGGKQVWAKLDSSLAAWKQWLVDVSCLSLSLHIYIYAMGECSLMLSFEMYKKKRIGAHAIISCTDSKRLASSSRLNISNKPSHSAIWIDMVPRQWCRCPTIATRLIYPPSMTATTNLHRVTNGAIFILVYHVWLGHASFSFYMMAILVHAWSILSSRVPSQSVNVSQCFFVISNPWPMLQIDDSVLKLFVYSSKCMIPFTTLSMQVVTNNWIQ